MNQPEKETSGNSGMSSGHEQIGGATAVTGIPSSRGGVGMNEPMAGKRTFVEKIEVRGSELVDKVKDLIEDSSTRRVIVRDKDGNELLSTPLSFGVVAGGLITVAAPVLAALGAAAALVTRVKLEVIREVEEEQTQPGQVEITTPEQSTSGGT